MNPTSDPMHTKFERLLSKSLTTMEVMTYYLVVHTGLSQPVFERTSHRDCLRKRASRWRDSNLKPGLKYYCRRYGLYLSSFWVFVVVGTYTFRRNVSGLTLSRLPLMLNAIGMWVKRSPCNGPGVVQRRDRQKKEFHDQSDYR